MTRSTARASKTRSTASRRWARSARRSAGRRSATSTRFSAAWSSTRARRRSAARQSPHEARRLGAQPQRPVAAVDADARERVLVSPPAPGADEKRRLVPGPLCRLAHPWVVLAERIREQAARAPDLRLDPLPRLAQLPSELLVPEAREVRMGDRVGADLDAGLRELAQLGPGQGREIVRVGRGLGGELRNVERPSTVREGGAGANCHAGAELLERGQHGEDPAKGVVEGDVQRVRGRAQELLGADRFVATCEQAAHLSQKRLPFDRERGRPRGGDGVVAEDEREAPAHSRVLGIRPARSGAAGAVLGTDFGLGSTPTAGIRSSASASPMKIQSGLPSSLEAKSIEIAKPNTATMSAIEKLSIARSPAARARRNVPR